ncbi:MAG: HDOD domain-containing protein [Iodobacter sp.]
MLTDLSAEEANVLLRGMVIPPRPDILLALEKAQGSEVPDFAEIARLISTDVALSAAVIKTVNSPYFSLSARVVSVQQALQLLGLKNLSNVVQGVVLRQVLSPGEPEDMVAFWNFSGSVAMVAAHLAESVHGVTPDEAYTLGLFISCGKPLMEIRFPGYTAASYQQKALSRTARIQEEERMYRVSHNVVGYLLARTWYLPADTSLAILNLHNFEVFQEPVPGEWSHICTLIALVCLAEHIVSCRLNQPVQAGWRQIEPLLCRYLALSQDELDDLLDHVPAMLFG